MFLKIYENFNEKFENIYYFLKKYGRYNMF